MRCFGCEDREAERGVLCAACASGLVRIERICPEQIQVRVSTDPARRRGWLVDGFGRPHPLAWGGPDAGVLVGRDPRCDVAVLDVSISQLHAELRYGAQSGAWFIVDRGSRNGVFVNDESVERSWLDSGDQVFFGTGLGFLFLDLDEARMAQAESALRRASEMSTPMATLEDAALGRGTPTEELVLQEAEGGGVARVGGQVVQLSLLQLELLTLLVERRRQDAQDGQEGTAGFIASKTLLASALSFETAQPTPANLKRLVRSVRNKFTAAGVPEVIESRQNLDYRLILTADPA